VLEVAGVAPDPLGQLLGEGLEWAEGHGPASLNAYPAGMPTSWTIAMAILLACLVASMVIAAVKL
jgi:hypothetical protein